MKADLSRDTFVARKHFAGVLLQQGRVPLDADPNEQLAIQRHRDYTEAEDVIGTCGAPKHEAGFLVQPTPDGKDLVVAPGRYYVHGRMCELESTPVAATWQTTTAVTVDTWHVDGADFVPNQYVELVASGVAPLVVRVQAVDQATKRLTLASSIGAFQNASGLRVRRLVTYLTQPDLPDPSYATPPGPQPPSLALPNGAYIVYLDVWPRHITALDDETIREKALGGPDTATRIRTVWQVKLWPGPNEGDPLPGTTDCGTPTGWDALAAPPTGRLNARTKPGPANDDPCIIPPGAGFLGLENQLYRVEVHAGGMLGTDPVRFVWSRDNGSVVKAIDPIPGTTFFTVDTGPDDVLGLANGQWVEQLDDAVVLNNVARNLFQFQIDPVTAAVTLSFPVDETRHPQLRRWDSPGQVTVPSPPLGDGWLDLEDGVQVRFEPGSYRRGDYWLIPARTVLGDIEWPRDGAGKPVPQPRRGVEHHYCRVGVLHASGATLTVDDCRTLFPPLNELKSTYTCCTYTVGDGTTYVGDFTTIQEAVNRLPADGGQICVYPGTYVENVRIEGKRNVHISGCGRRTRVQSRPANADGAADAVFTVSSSERVKIESLAIEAAATAPGILVAGEKPSRVVVLQRLSVTARKDSAIKVRDGEDILIERCRVTMLDGNGGWPGIFLRAVDSAVRRSVVRGVLVGMDPRKVYTLTGSMAVSALQLGGGCERIQVDDNVFQGCTGQGITLGSQIEVTLDGRPIDPTGGGGWVIDRNDPCFPCEDPTTGDRPPRDGADEPPTRFESEGDLYDIEIRHNRISDMGLDGIGVTHFFDLERQQRGRGLVRIEDLTIVDNRVQRCVRRGFAPIPPRMLDLMAYGGISLSVVEGLVIRDNRVEDLGFGGLLPTCGIFVLYGEGIEIARNHVLNAGTERVSSDAVALAGRRGGIHIVYAMSLEGTTPPVETGAPTPAARAVGRVLPGIRRLEAAAVIEENSVDVARGQALSLGALGPVAVIANRLISRGVAVLDRRALIQSASLGLANVLTHLSSLVAIVNLASPAAAFGVANLGAGMKTNASPSLAAVIAREAAASRVLVDDNQCVLHLTGQENEGPLLLPAILIVSLDDVGFQDNQCDCVFAERSLLPVATVILAFWSQRTVSNRFTEPLGKAFYSALTFALMNMTANNQANHCLWMAGPLLLQDQPNHVLVTALQKDYCPAAGKRLAAVLGGLAG